MLDLTEYLDRKPKALSGGQRQRVAMGRAIVREPQVFLMDEPLSNLDAKLRVSTRTQIASLQRRLGITTVYVTHDQVEAMTMGDRVAVLKDGLLQQVDTPRNMYDRPANLFVAGFIGSPAMNLVEVPITDGGVKFGNSVVPVSREALTAAADKGDTHGHGRRPPRALRHRRARRRRRQGPHQGDRGRPGRPRRLRERRRGARRRRLRLRHRQVGGEHKDLVVRVGGRAVPEKGATLHVVPRAGRDPRLLDLDGRAPHRLTPHRRRRPGTPSRCGRPFAEARAARLRGPPRCHGKYPGRPGHFDPCVVNPRTRKARSNHPPNRVTKCRQIITARYPRSRDTPHSPRPASPAGSAAPSPSSCPSSWCSPGPSRSPASPGRRHASESRCSPPPRRPSSDARRAPAPRRTCCATGCSCELQEKDPGVALTHLQRGGRTTARRWRGTACRSPARWAGPRSRSTARTRAQSLRPSRLRHVVRLGGRSAQLSPWASRGSAGQERADDRRRARQFGPDRIRMPRRAHAGRGPGRRPGLPAAPVHRRPAQADGRDPGHRDPDHRPSARLAGRRGRDRRRRLLRPSRRGAPGVAGRRPSCRCASPPSSRRSRWAAAAASSTPPPQLPAPGPALVRHQRRHLDPLLAARHGRLPRRARRDRHARAGPAAHPVGRRGDGRRSGTSRTSSSPRRRRT